MLTPRGWWLIFWAGLFAALSLPWLAFWSPTVSIISFSVIVWFLFEWILFQLRCKSAAHRLQVERHLIQNDRELPTLWSKVRCTVRVRVTNPSQFRLPFVTLADKLPEGMHLLGGQRRLSTSLNGEQSLDFEYEVLPLAPGFARFEGITVQVADLSGLFYRRLFLRLPEEYFILPPMTNDEGGQRATKRLNSLPPPGIHRLRKPGSGDELLDLREYRPGDPPKMIAWKASARRDMLITKEFENDVPVRAILYIDDSESTKLGEVGFTPLSRLCTIGAGVAQASAANRDLIGLTVFNEDRSQVIKPARTRSHTMNLLRTLAETAGQLPNIAFSEPKLIEKFTQAKIQEMYPELLDKSKNSLPFGLFWRPLLDSRFGWLILLFMFSPILIFKKEVLNFIADFGQEITEPGLAWRGMLALWLMPGYVGLAYWIIYGLSGYWPSRARKLARRKQMAAVFAALDDTRGREVARPIHDDDVFQARATEFLTLHRICPPLSLYDENNQYRYLAEGKITTLVESLIRNLGRAKDNELYILLADLIELDAHLSPLLGVIRAAVGRHHQVLILLPWPLDLAPPSDKDHPPNAADTSPELGEFLRKTVELQYHQKFERTRNQLVKAGASVVRIDQTDPVPLILSRIDRLRHMGVRR